MDEKNIKMNKKFLVSFLFIASVLFLVGMASAGKVTSTFDQVKVNGVDATADNVAVTAGDTILIKVVFTANKDYSDVKVKATLEGNNNNDVTDVTSKFDVEDGRVYSKILTLKVPSDLDSDEISEVRTLNIEISGDDAKDKDEDYKLNVQRDSYDLAIKLVNVNGSIFPVSSPIYAGEKLPVDVVIKNVGYNELDEVYVTAYIEELPNIRSSDYLGDLVTRHYLEEDDDNDGITTVSGRLNLAIPYDVKEGSYTLVVTARNDETESTASGQIEITNSVSDVAIKSGNDLILINPTNKIAVYNVAYSEDEQTVVIPAGSSKTVSIEVPTGDYNFDVVVYSGNAVLSTVNYSGSSEGDEVQLTSPVFVLTVILAIVFLVLLVVLIVLITKKPQKAEEFGESYY